MGYGWVQMSTELCAAPNKTSVPYRTYPYKRRTITAVRHRRYTDPMPARKPLEFRLQTTPNGLRTSNALDTICGVQAIGCGTLSDKSDWSDKSD